MTRFVAKRKPVPPTQVIAFADLLVGLFDAGWITESEFNDWISKTALPTVAQDLIDALPTAAERVRARRFVLGATEAERGHPILRDLAEEKRIDLGWTEQQMLDAIDEMFRRAPAV